MTIRPSTLAELEHGLVEASRRAERLWAATDDPCVQPAGGGWSVAQCLSHLALSTNAYLPVWRAALEAPGGVERLEAPRPLRLDAWGRVLGWFLEPPAKIRFRTKNGFEAPSSPAALEEFLASQRELLQLIGRLEGIAIDRIQIRSAFEERVRYSIWSSLVITLIHQRRHIWQAENAKATRAAGAP